MGLGAILSQDIHGQKHPIVSLSQKLTTAEKSYALVEWECLTIRWTLESLWYYLLGNKIQLVSDPAPLIWI